MSDQASVLLGSDLDGALLPSGVPSSDSSRRVFRVAGAGLEVETDAPRVFDEVAFLVGSEIAPDPAGPVVLRAEVRLGTSLAGRGRLTLSADDDAVSGSADDIHLGLLAPDPVFTRVGTGEDGWTHVALRGETEPLFSIKDRHCLFRRGPGWESAVALFVFNRFLRARRDAIFFHGASVALGGRGVLIVGPKEAGKSTTALALAARGHALLGDDMACYLPATGRLVPFARALGIRPGPRSLAVSGVLERLGRVPEEAGAQRIPVHVIALGAPPQPTPLAAVLLLEGFADRPEVTRVPASRDHLARLQPMVGSLVNASHAERVFQMARLLSRVAVFRVKPGDPDETARRIEEALTA